MEKMFNEFEKANVSLANAKIAVEKSVHNLVSELQKEKGYVEFDEETCPYFEDDAIGFDRIVAVMYTAYDGKLKLLTESQGFSPADGGAEWFDWKAYGHLNLTELGYALIENSKK